MLGVVRGLSGTLVTIGRAIGARPLLFAGVALAVVALDLFLPVVVLTVFRKPFDHFSFNPWLKHAPAWAMSPAVPFARKIEFLTNVALFWFIASSPYDEPEWGFSASPPDVVRWLYMGAVFGAYFALWFYAGRRRGAQHAGAVYVSLRGRGVWRADPPGPRARLPRLDQRYARALSHHLARGEPRRADRDNAGRPGARVVDQSGGDRRPGRHAGRESRAPRNRAGIKEPLVNAANIDGCG